MQQIEILDATQRISDKLNDGVHDVVDGGNSRNGR